MTIFNFVGCYSLAFHLQYIFAKQKQSVMLLDIAKYEKVFLIYQNYTSTLNCVLFYKMNTSNPGLWSNVNTYPKSEVLIPVAFYLHFSP